MAHVGSPDTFYTGKAGPYDVRVSVRLPGVIPGRAQVSVRVPTATKATDYQVAVRAGQWNVGLEGAPPYEPATPVPGDPTLYAAELWFMTASSYQMAVHVIGPSGEGTAIVPVLALATEERPMPAWLGTVLAGLGIFLTLGFLTMIASAVRESALPPGAQPDARRRGRARLATAITAVLLGLILWGGNVWWNAEATAYSQSVLYRPFATTTSIAAERRDTFTLSIRDPRWTGSPIPGSRYNALLPDHGKLMHLFLVRDDTPDALAHLHPVARTPEALDFDAPLPPLPSGRYRAYADIVHESGYAQTLVSTLEVREPSTSAALDPDDSWFTGTGVTDGSSPTFDLPDGSRLVWQRGDATIVAGTERVLAFSVRDAGGVPATVEPYMGMAAHVIVASRDGRVFAHLHPSGSISMAALQKFAGGPLDPHAAHGGADPNAAPAGDAMLAGAVDIPFAFPKAGAYRIWVQVKRGGNVMTGAFDVSVTER